MKFPHIRLVATLGALIALGWAGCASAPEVKYTATTCDDQRVTFHMVNGSVEHPSEAGIQTDTPKLEPNPKEKKFIFLVRLFVNTAEPPRSIKVEDVSDDQPVLLAESTNPEIRNHEWRDISRTLTMDDPAMKWLTYLDQSFRIFRFTVVLADGRTVVLHDGVMVPGYGKAMLRHLMGLNY